MTGDRESDASVPRLPAAGDVVLGKYRVERILGEGGMGAVFAATHLDLRRRVAIKFLRPTYAKERASRERFLREARAAASITSEHSAHILDVGEDGAGLPFLVMELLEGNDLERVLEARGRLGAEEAAGYLLEACEAIAEAHAAGIVHRDLKPSNLFLATRPDGTSVVKVLDFGISKTLVDSEDGPTRSALTAPNTLLGSPQYMAPEQVRDAKGVDVRGDVWALGVILYELIAGVPPFASDSVPELCAKILSSAPPPLRRLAPEVPAGLDEVVARCLAKDPAARIADLAELSRALRPFVSRERAASVERIARTLGSAGLRREALAGASPGSPYEATVDAGRSAGRHARRVAAAAGVALVLGTFAFVGARAANRRSSPSLGAIVAPPPPPASAPSSDPATPAPTEVPPPSTLRSGEDASAPAATASSAHAPAASHSAPHKVKDLRQIQLLE